jgi:hypothetical protein
MRPNALAFVFIPFALLSGCRSTSCVPGQSVACAGVNSCSGFQTCSIGGAAFGPCVCGQPDGGGGNLDMAVQGAVDMSVSTAYPCAQLAAQICTSAMTCAPKVFQLDYESSAICNAVLTQQCMAGLAAGDTGLRDPVACIAAVGASCDAYLGFITGVLVPDACKRKIGSGIMGASCRYDSQCAAGYYCYGMATSPVPLCPGQCLQAGNPCNVDHDCDSDNGQRCVPTFQAGTPPTSDGNRICQTITRGVLGAACVAGTNVQCANGLGCDGNDTCQLLLAASASCDGANAPLCDFRKGDTCAPNPAGGGNICTPISVVGVGGQCGPVGAPPINQICSSYALCTGAPTLTCVARVQPDGACTAQPDNCYPGLRCTGGTCQTAPLTTCM